MSYISIPPHGRSVGLKLVAFDLDGTLANLPIDWDALRARVREFMGTDHPLKPLGPSIPVAAKGDRELEEAAFRIVEEAELEAARQARPDPELRRALEALRSRGVKIALVTLQARRPALTALEGLGVRDLFDVVVTRENGMSRDDQLAAAMREVGARPEETALVGDMPWDAEAGRKLGVLTVIVGEKAQGDQNVSSAAEAARLLLEMDP